ncbi:germination-specific N-acetylmuramoyl-L-alanine amidase precursor [Ruminiclostridium hungatei]|uniref:Germination-specific N-acetylmuramoyl-L-alanine amidase n=1 Tax=Ruminiclostridium hungatei TaxID=48256 RepID=A0A1V4SQ90_RUMHU|nr:N-acetylmuramoyl-L-alanine amidase [Ruminiclostridium hungatei]OPX46049.1 germination-specific N-acetylmuramoyl-L-alanine amidase precursor [Ruminiclostridium hungatei]
MRRMLRIMAAGVALILLSACGGQYQGASEAGHNGKTVSASGYKAGGEFRNTSGSDGGLAELASNAGIKKAQQGKKLQLEGLNICIDPGHGKVTKKIKKTEPVAPGSTVMKAATAVGTSGAATKITEESLNLAVSLKLKKALSEKGAKLIMVRETDVCNMTNVERTEFWNKSGADLTIRIHANGSDNSKVSGMLMLIPGNKYIKDKAMLEKSAKAGQYIMEAVLGKTKARSQGIVKSSDMTGFNWSKIPVVLLEMGFMTNPEEDRLLNTPDYQDKIVAGIVEGIERYSSYLN